MLVVEDTIGPLSEPGSLGTPAGRLHFMRFSNVNKSSVDCVTLVVCSLHTNLSWLNRTSLCVEYCWCGFLHGFMIMCTYVWCESFPVLICFVVRVCVSVSV